MIPLRYDTVSTQLNITILVRMAGKVISLLLWSMLSIFLLWSTLSSYILVMIYAKYILRFFSLQVTYQLRILFTALFSWGMLGRRLTLTHCFALVFLMIGVALVQVSKFNRLKIHELASLQYFKWVANTHYRELNG